MKELHHYYLNRRAVLAGVAMGICAAGKAASAPPIGATARPFEIIGRDLGFTEGLLVLPDGSILVSNMTAGQMIRIRPDGGSELFASVPGKPAGVSFGVDGDLYITNMGGLKPDDPAASLLRMNPVTKQLSVLVDTYKGKLLRSPDDLAIDRAGGIYFTVFGERPDIAMPPGVYYWDGHDLRLAVLATVPTNGIGISPDDEWLYWTEYSTGRLFRRRIVGPGVLQPPARPFADCLFQHPAVAFFDSLRIDNEGYVSVAVHNGEETSSSGILTFSDVGVPVEFVTFPDVWTTNIALSWTGPKVAYVTLSKTHQVIKMPWPRHGQLPRFAPRAGFS